MLNNNSRIEMLNGIRFYEQDIIYDDHTYTGDIEIKITGSYLAPGFGIAMMNNEGLALNEQKEIFLFKTGMRESTVYYKNGIIQKTVKRSSTILEPPHNDITFTFSKKGRIITLSSSDNDQPLVEYTLPNNNWDKYSIGFYSNAGNIIKYINIAASIPKWWTVNMNNTQGGYVKFMKSGFELINCKNDAEIEQSEISLKKGLYYLKYESSIDSDIVPYVFMHGNEEVLSKDKNILNGKFFNLEEDSVINIRFAGKSGIIKNMILCKDAGSKYIATKDDVSKINGSYININLKDVESINITASVSSIPDSSSIEFDSEKPYIIKNDLNYVNISDTNIKFGQLYNYVYSSDTNSLKIEEKNNVQNISEHRFNIKDNNILMFNNMDVTIVDFKIKKSTSLEMLDLLKDDTEKAYVNKNVNSPIIVIDNENIPFNLSSSYRIINENEDIRYKFSNIEREIFNSSNYIELESLPSNINKVLIYGIYKNAIKDESKIYYGSDNPFDDISDYTKNFIRLSDDDINSIDINKGTIFLQNTSMFESIIVDYEKKDSYCINYIEDLSMYEITVSSSNQEYKILYDEPIEKNGIEEIEQYKQIKDINGIPVEPENKKYIVIRKE